MGAEVSGDEGGEMGKRLELGKGASNHPVPAPTAGTEFT